MEKTVIKELEDTLNRAATGLSQVKSKKMFGCHALFTNENVFALVWKHGRIGVKLPDESPFEKLMAQKGSEPWKAGNMTMSHWVLVPETFHKTSAPLKSWLKTAHTLCGKLEKKQPKKTPKKK